MPINLSGTAMQVMGAAVAKKVNVHLQAMSTANQNLADKIEAITNQKAYVQDVKDKAGNVIRKDVTTYAPGTSKKDLDEAMKKFNSPEMMKLKEGWGK